MNIYIKVTEKCNLRCLHCYNTFYPEKLDIDKTISFLKKLPNNEKNYFIFHGGEPLLTDITSMKKVISNFPNTKFRITTNLTSKKLSKSDIEFLCLLDQVRTSFDIKIRFGNIKNLLIWYYNVKELIKNGCNLSVNFCFTKELIDRNPEDILRFVKKLGIKEFLFERLSATGCAKQNNLFFPSYKKIDNWLCSLYDIWKEKYSDIKCSEFFQIQSGILHQFEFCRCKECCMNTLTINSNGTVGNCPNDARINILGNIDDNPLDILHKIKCKERKLNSNCLLCDKFGICKGYCLQLDWQEDVCPYPINLSDKLNIDIKHGILIK